MFWSRSVSRLSVCLSAVAVCAMATAACSLSDNSAAPDDSTSAAVMTTITSIPSQPAESGGNSRADNASRNDEETDNWESHASSSEGLTLTGDCGVRPYDSEILYNLHTLPHNANGWEPTDNTNYNRCTDLSYALITEGGTDDGLVDTQLMLFHKGEYLGIGSDRAQHTDILSTTEDSVTVRMQDWEAWQASGEPVSAVSSYYSDVTFRWNGERVVPEGRIPNLSMPGADPL